MTSMQEIKTKAEKLGGIDPDVKVPAAIRAAAARAEALHAQQYTPEEQQPAAQPAGEKQNGEERQPATPEPEAKAPAQDRQEGAATPEGGEDWQHRYNSLKGRYDRQEDTIRGLNGRISQMESLLARAQATPAPEPVRTRENTFKGVTAEERENYGDDFLDVSARAAQERLNPTIAELRKEIDGLKGQLGGVAQQTAAQTQASMNQFLDANLATWRAINKDQKFLAWVNLPDQYSGAIRINMLKDAYEKGDAPRVLRFFQGYLADEAATAPAGHIEPEKPKGKVPLENFAAPGRAKAPATTQVPGEKETISRSQIAAFYLKVNKGDYRGNEAEKNRLEQMIFDAEAEGRITP